MWGKKDSHAGCHMKWSHVGLDLRGSQIWFILKSYFWRMDLAFGCNWVLTTYLWEWMGGNGLGGKSGVRLKAMCLWQVMNHRGVFSAHLNCGAVRCSAARRGAARHESPTILIIFQANADAAVCLQTRKGKKTCLLRGGSYKPQHVTVVWPQVMGKPTPHPHPRLRNTPRKATCFLLYSIYSEIDDVPPPC